MLAITYLVHALINLLVLKYAKDHRVHRLVVHGHHRVRAAVGEEHREQRRHEGVGNIRVCRNPRVRDDCAEKGDEEFANSDAGGLVRHNERKQAKSESVRVWTLP